MKEGDAAEKTTQDRQRAFMRIGLTYESKGFPRDASRPGDLDSELLAAFEVDELLSGLRDAGHSVLLIEGSRALLNRIGYWRNRCDLVFNKSVGSTGVARKVHTAAILEVAGIPYMGSGPYALALTRHKHHAKLVAASAGLLTPPALLVPPAGRKDLEALEFPVIVKPVAESSSIGIELSGSVVATAQDAASRAQHLAERYGQQALVETFVHGAEIEVPITVDSTPRAAGCLAIALNDAVVEEDRFLTSELVYRDDYGFVQPPKYVPVPTVEAAAITAAAALGIRDYGRIDFRVDRDGRPWFIEASTHPHLQRHSSFAVLAENRGLHYWQMLDELVAVAASRTGLLHR